MTETTIQITEEELKKLLDESFLSGELKTAYSEVLGKMNEKEKNELKRIIEKGNEAAGAYEKERLENLARLNAALQEQLQKIIREERKYIRREFENLSTKEEKTELGHIEQELNIL